MDARAFFVSEDTVAVVLFFIDPAGLVEWLTHESCKHRLSAEWNLVGQRNRRERELRLRKKFFGVLVCVQGPLSKRMLCGRFSKGRWFAKFSKL